jgi:hypothetical protein
MADEPTPKSLVLPDARRPLVLVGPPSLIQGELNVQNLADRKVVVRRPVLQPGGLRAGLKRRGKMAGAGLQGDALPLRRIVVRAGQSRHVPIALSLDPSTPPGTYQASLDVEGETKPVVVHVTEQVAFSMSPSEVVLPGRAGEKVHKQVVFANTGNVPLSIRNIGVVVLDEELAHCRALRGALADVGETMKNLDDFIAALGRRYRAAYETLALKVQNDQTTVEPGETQVVDLTIALPGKLDARARYTGYAAISTGSLTFTIVPE